MSLVAAEPSKMALKKYLDMDNSIATMSTEVCSVSTGDCSELTSPVGPPSRKLRFDTTPSGQVKCQVKSVERLTDPGLWWQDDEVAAIRSECSRLIEAERTNPRGLRAATIQFLKKVKKHQDEEPRKEFRVKMAETSVVRGLEFYVVPECKRSSIKHIKTVVEMQAMKVDDAVLKLASNTRSRLFTELARQRAQFDVEEAAKACQSSWTC